MTHTFLDIEWYDLHTNIYQGEDSEFHENQLHQNIESYLPKYTVKPFHQQNTASSNDYASVIDVFQHEDQIYSRLGSCFKVC